ncbi:hypothetical protein RhiirA1_436555 [Rhizophagus irregularis]|uniref:Ion transport domain-containing protein n=2 Tax=Rhizophagus irregularis TaxID=588596 RepID=A0A2I1E5T7_9GLOM|nr:hypothetical protein GLOIN_2v1471389 [Rhizophagus irregularis DAOM 181602=DAOM 197198]PKC74978.1 hypothetical protein RhiirA1_436555 [Rhizophagus irregularis]PKY17483.1 hypothetical protein RhiirB3_467996 [Rhizophagus irregularis]POG80629.1 hypothetical protein GLOIN_2v1471389 [Rhizophagus irregularis DAOM 181602=DAOM 197198]|eukprot:XP_025187495.1 hypothetical protein GLOIN_2v1471389 [Rhizophagus irregularis DAOM 181602=DAOM 197198]
MDSFFIQKPDENTNMFIDFRTALLAMYTFLTGDSSALSNWLYLDNQAIVILVILFSLLVFVYLMNLFIGLLNMAINKDNERVSYLKQKAEIDKLEKKIDNVDGKIDKVEGKVDTIEEKNNTIDATLQQLLKEIRELKENKK